MIDLTKQDNININLSSKDVLLIFEAINSKCCNLLDDQINYDVDTENERKEYKRLALKLESYMENK